MFTFQPLGWFGVLQLGVARTMPNLNTVSPDKARLAFHNKTYGQLTHLFGHRNLLVSKLFSSHINSILFPPHALLELHANAYSQAPLTTQSLTLHNASTNQFLPPKYRPITGEENFDPLTTDQISDVKSPTKPAETVPEKRPVFGILHVAHPSYAPPSETCYYSSSQWDDTSDESYYNSNASGFSSAY
ncbi:hypothetical protein BDP27DRAFT_1349008 [Rhodocollybia butyracea]|uniref:Uncharacterized protein n=1 Tax=Rhodocollybia butyracea TaxID=206335 RepID=A0A9P5P5X7_9AGAR|nr:hypothetical protein BDP27DRAFT_1349008 [Rhodocollybia butyracea]